MKGNVHLTSTIMMVVCVASSGCAKKHVADSAKPEQESPRAALSDDAWAAGCIERAGASSLIEALEAKGATLTGLAEEITHRPSDEGERFAQLRLGWNPEQHHIDKGEVTFAFEEIPGGVIITGESTPSGPPLEQMNVESRRERIDSLQKSVGEVMWRWTTLFKRELGSRESAGALVLLDHADFSDPSSATYRLRVTAPSASAADRALLVERLSDSSRAEVLGEVCPGFIAPEKDEEPTILISTTPRYPRANDCPLERISPYLSKLTPTDRQNIDNTAFARNLQLRLVAQHTHRIRYREAFACVAAALGSAPEAPIESIEFDNLRFSLLMSEAPGEPITNALDACAPHGVEHGANANGFVVEVHELASAAEYKFDVKDRAIEELEEISLEASFEGCEEARLRAFLFEHYDLEDLDDALVGETKYKKTHEDFRETRSFMFLHSRPGIAENISPLSLRLSFASTSRWDTLEQRAFRGDDFQRGLELSMSSEDISAADFLTSIHEALDVNMGQGVVALPRSFIWEKGGRGAASFQVLATDNGRTAIAPKVASPVIRATMTYSMTYTIGDGEPARRSSKLSLPTLVECVGGVVEESPSVTFLLSSDEEARLADRLEVERARKLSTKELDCIRAGLDKEESARQALARSSPGEPLERRVYVSFLRAADRHSGYALEASSKPEAKTKPRTSTTPENEASEQAGARPGIVSFDAPLQKVGGKLDTNEIEQLLVEERKRARIEQCYADALEQDSKAQGKITLVFTIGSAGRVTRANVTIDTVNHGVGDCVSMLISHMRFTRPSGGDVTISKTFTFKPNREP